MVLSGTSVWIVAILLLTWLGLLCWATRRTLKATSPSHPRVRLTAAGLIASAIAILSALILDLSWIAPDISQKMGFGAIRIIAMLLFWPSATGLFLCIGGVGRARFFGITTSLLTGLWWFTLWMGSAISMGSPIARHPIEYLIPSGYVGWIKIKRGENAAALPLSQGKFICYIPQSGIVETSTLIEDGWASDSYFYYDGQAKVRQLRQTGWGDGGSIWPGMTEFESAPQGVRPQHMVENFFVGTEDQYHHSVDQDRH